MKYNLLMTIMLFVVGNIFYYSYNVKEEKVSPERDFTNIYNRADTGKDPNYVGMKEDAKRLADNYRILLARNDLNIDLEGYLMWMRMANGNVLDGHYDDWGFYLKRVGGQIEREYQAEAAVAPKLLRRGLFKKKILDFALRIQKDAAEWKN